MAAAAAQPVTAAALFAGKGTLAHEKALRSHALGGQSSAWDVCHAAAANLLFPNPNAPKRAGAQPVPDAFRALALALEAEAADPGAWAPLASNAKGYTWLEEDQAKLITGERRSPQGWLPISVWPAPLPCAGGITLPRVNLSLKLLRAYSCASPCHPAAPRSLRDLPGRTAGRPWCASCWGRRPSPASPTCCSRSGTG